MLARTKPPKCAYCGDRTEAIGRKLHEHCVDPWVAKQREKKARAMEKKLAEARRNEKRRIRARLDAIKPAKELKPLAQDAFNRYIRLRDAHLPCVSCGATNPPMTTGGQWDAGHFKSRGSHPELAFDEDNCHKQCKECNGGSAYTKHNERVVSARYEEELLRRIGPERLARLNGPHPIVKRTADDYRALRAEYQAKARELKRKAHE